MKVSALKNVGIWAVIALLLVSCFALMSCQSDEDAIRSNLDAELSAVKNLDQETLDRYMGEVGDDAGLEMFNIDMNEFVKSCFEGFDYTIDEINVDGDTATAKTTLTHKSLDEAMTTWQTDFTALIAGESAASMTQSELYAAAGQLLMDCINEAPTTTTTVDIPYVKSDGKWTLAPEAQTVFSEVFAGDLI